MLLLHPHRLWKSFLRKLRNGLFMLQCRFRHVDCRLGNNCRLEDCRIFVPEGSGQIVIGDNCVIRYCTFAFYGHRGLTVIGDHSIINGRQDARTGLYVKDHTTLTIGRRSMISNLVEISTTDWHWIIDNEGAVVNENRDVMIGEHVWICRRSLIGKGVSIGNDSVVGACSVVTKSCPESHVLLAGDPAVVKKRGIDWKQ